MRVCEKVKEKMTTTYNEVADELVDEYVKEHAIISDQVCFFAHLFLLGHGKRLVG